jgi:dihydrofolate reductase
MNNKTKDRPQISIYIAASVNGYIAREDHSLDWLDQVNGFNEELGFQEFLDSIDTIILGRNTYEVVEKLIAGFSDWPYKGKRVIVLSSGLQSVKKDVELFQGDLAQLASQLHAEGVQHIWIDGGVTVSKFLEHQMVDTMTLSVIPVILGSGIPLFSLTKELSCHLISSQSFPSGLVKINYAFK